MEDSPSAVWGQFNVAAALENYYVYLSEQHESREGLHVSDVTGKHGWRCDRFLHLAMKGAETNPTQNRKFTQKRFLLGDAAHRMVYEYIKPALEMAYGGLIQIESIEIEKEFVHEPTGIIGTPDIVITGKWDNGRRFCLVIDVKSLTAWAYESQCTLKEGFKAKPQDRRQLLFYVDAKKADMGKFLNVLITKGENDIGQTRYDHNQKFLAPNGSVVDHTMRRMEHLKSLEKRGEWGQMDRGSHCKICKLQEACESINAELSGRAPDL